MAPALKSYEGRVGRRHPDLGIFITSPNMDTSTEPLLGIQAIRMRQQLHFGEHDPCYAPQPFNSRTPHLACLQFPQSLDNGFSAFMWFLPSPDDFVLIDNTVSSLRLGTIRQHFCDVLSDEYLKIKKRVSAYLTATDDGTGTYQRVKGDAKLWDYRARIQYLLGRMSAPSTYEEAAMTWRLTQRLCLEFDARFTWISRVQTVFYTSEAKQLPLQSVVGTITDQLDVALNCYRAGIPVWVFRPLGAETGLRVDKWLDEGSSKREFGCHVCFDDESPPFPTIFSGKISDLERYRSMARFGWKRAFPSTIFGDDDSTSTVQYDPPATTQSARQPEISRPSSPSPSSSAQSSSSRPSSNQSSGFATSTSRHSSARTSPYVKPSHKKPKSQDHNKFVDVMSPFMPQALRIWAQASAASGKAL